ncbi:MAG: leucine-rich repeat protein [Lachnospiraceae bacterium]|nr:leucine-rich repeat protein [Lachnospiraceae bacterium]
MWETVALTTFLLLMFLGLRRIVDGRISARFQYALWLIVAVRLLFAWVPMPDSSISILPLIRESVGTFTQMAQDFVHTDAIEGDSLTDNGTATDIKLSEDNGIASDSKTPVNSEIAVEDGLAETLSDDGKQSMEQADIAGISEKKNAVGAEDTTGVEKQSGITKILMVVYGSGVCVMILVILLRNLIFYLSLRKVRVSYEGGLPVKHIPGKVYLLEQAASPFLFGRNIYIAPEMMQDKKSLQYCLAHEICHFKQGDVFWSVIRNLCLVMYWYHPLVWLCARLSENDAELACDERVIALLGEYHRMGYGETLLSVIKKQAWSSGYMNLSTQMSGSKRSVEKRIERIAQKGTRWLSAAVFVVIGMAVTLLSTFPDSLNSNDVSDVDIHWAITETEGFPAMVVDDKGNVVDFVRGHLLHKMYFSYYNLDETYSIQENAFSNCTNLRTLIIDELVNIDEIDDNAFEGCPKDMVVYCAKDSYVWDYFQENGFRVKEYNSREDVLWQKLDSKPEEQKMIKELTSYGYDPEDSEYTPKDIRQVYGEPYFVMTQSGKLLVQHSESLSYYTQAEVLLPKEATALESTFSNNISMTKTVTIPNTIVEIGNSAFLASSLERLEMEEGSNLEKIGECAFMHSPLSEITMQEGLKEIGRNAFFWCEPLKEVTIPSSVEKVGGRCFGGCKLETVTVLNPNMEFPEDVENEAVFDKEVVEDETLKVVPNTRLTIRCYKGSTAEVYAKQLNLKVEYIEPQADHVEQETSVNIYLPDENELEFPQVIEQYPELIRDVSQWKGDDGSYHFPFSRYDKDFRYLNTAEERLAALQFPEEILKLESDTLLSLVLESRIPESVRNLDTRPDAFIMMAKRYNSIYELLGRPDFYDSVSKYFKKYHVPKKISNDAFKAVAVMDTIDFCTVVLLGMTADVNDKSIEKAADVVYDKLMEIEATEYRDDVIMKTTFFQEPHFPIDKRVTVRIDAYNRKKAEQKLKKKADKKE